MRRGEIYRVRKPLGTDPRRFRFFVVVSRPALIASRFSTVVCAPIYSSHEGLSTQLPVGPKEGLAHDSSIHCDALMTIQKARLTDFVSMLSPEKIAELNKALVIALHLDNGA